MSEIKKHYMRTKRKCFQEEVFSYPELDPEFDPEPDPEPNLPKITIDRFSEPLNINILPNINISTNDAQLELLEDNNYLESDLFVHESIYESDQLNENFPLSFLSSSDSVDLDVRISIFLMTILKKIIQKRIQLKFIQWSLMHNISHTALNDLLKTLKGRIPELPTDVRSLLKTCHTVISKVIEPGQYYHFGVENCIKNLINCSTDFF